MKILNDILILKKEEIMTNSRHLKGIKTILIESNPLTGDYRLNKYIVKIIDPLSKDPLGTIVTENGIKLRVQPIHTFYNPVYSTDRLRVYNNFINQTNRDILLVGGAGIGPYSIQLAPLFTRVIAIDINSQSCRLHMINNQVNKCSNIAILNEDLLRFLDKYPVNPSHLLIISPLQYQMTIKAIIKFFKKESAIFSQIYLMLNRVSGHVTYSRDLDKLGLKIKQFFFVKPYSSSEAIYRIKIIRF